MSLCVFWTLSKGRSFGGRFPSAPLQDFSGFGADQGPRGGHSTHSFCWVVLGQGCWRGHSSQHETIQSLAEMKGQRPGGQEDKGPPSGERDRAGAYMSR